MEGVELLPYRNYIFSSFISGGTAPTATSLQPEKRSRPRATAASVRSLDGRAGEKNSLSAHAVTGERANERGSTSGQGLGEGSVPGNNELFFVLSMGHRIHFLVYDPSQVRLMRDEG